jgi:hypothetical protein
MIIMTNRPPVSREYKNGHLVFVYYHGGEITPYITVDGVSKTIDVVDINYGLIVLHIPCSEFQTGSRVLVELKESTTVMASYTINITKTSHPSYKTLAWINEKGGIDTYTFFADARSDITTEKDTIYTSSGLQTIKSTSDTEYSFYSDAETQAVRLWLSELVNSPRVWRLDTMTLVDIISHELRVISPDMEQMQITFRDAKRKTTQTL